MAVEIILWSIFIKVWDWARIKLATPRSAVWLTNDYAILKTSVANSVDLDQTAPYGAVRAWSILFALKLKLMCYES